MQPVDAHTKTCLRGTSPTLWRYIVEDGSHQHCLAWSVVPGWDMGREAEKSLHPAQCAMGNWQSEANRERIESSSSFSTLAKSMPR